MKNFLKVLSFLTLFGGATLAIGAALPKCEEMDYKKAMELFDKSCNDGVALICYGAGTIYETGKSNCAARNKHIKKDTKKALEYYKKACDLEKKSNHPFVGCESYDRLRQGGSL